METRSQKGQVGLLGTLSRRQRLAWLVGCTVLYAAIALYAYRDLWLGGIAVVSPVRKDWGGWIPFREWDLRYAIWATARNAHALLEPWKPFFDSGQCYPRRESLALGHGVFSLGLLALPLQALTTDPVALYNLVLMVLAVTAPLAMWLLVTDVTGVPAAGVVAGLAYGFGSAKIGDPDHAFLTDTAWFTLAILFLRRALGAQRPMRDAIGVAVCASGQLAAGIYPAVGSCFVGLVFLVGLALEERPSLRDLRRFAAPLAAALAVLVVAAYAMYRPYFRMLAAGVFVERGRVFLSAKTLIPHGGLFPGPHLLILGGVAMLASRWRGNRDSFTFRMTVLVGTVVGVFLATGGLFSVSELDVPSAGQHARTLTVQPTALYRWLADWIPGLSIGRGPAYAYGAAYVCLALLAGLGAASAYRWLVDGPWLRRLRPSVRAPLAAGLLISAVGVTAVVRLPHFTVVRTRPSEAELELFRGLERRGNRGPLLELPIDEGLLGANRASAALVVAAYHRRPTSVCFASFLEESLDARLRAAIARLPSPAALDVIAAEGFTTLYVHNDGDGPALSRKLLGAGRHGVKRVLAGERGTVFQIR